MGDNGRLGHGNTTNSLSIPCLAQGSRQLNVVQIGTSMDNYCVTMVDPQFPRSAVPTRLLQQQG